MRVILDPGDVIINTPPTFGMYSFDCAVNGEHQGYFPYLLCLFSKEQKLITYVWHYPFDH